jgi:hypothetical protein
MILIGYYYMDVHSFRKAKEKTYRGLSEQNREKTCLVLYMFLNESIQVYDPRVER